MKITVMVKPNARQERLEDMGQNSYSAWVKAKPVEGKATAAVINILAEHFGVSRSRVILLKGQTSRHKVFEIR